MPTSNPELRALIKAIPLAYQSNIQGGQLVSWAELVAKCNIARLIRLAKFHGLLPWLNLNIENLPKDQQEAFQLELDQAIDLAKVQRFLSHQQCQSASNVVSALKAENVISIVFKGSAVLHQIYPQFIKSRVSDDLDLLINNTALPDALSILERRGYQVHEMSNVSPHKVARFIEKYPKWYRGRDFSLVLESGMKHKIDLHWKVADDFSFSANSQMLLSDIIAVETPFGPLPTLPFNKHFVYLCVHGYCDYFFRLKYLADVYAATQHVDFNKEEAYAFADECGVSTAVDCAISLAQSLFSLGEDKPLNDYSKIVIDRLNNHNGFTPRVHPNKRAWNRKDKNNHLIRQIKNRSKKAPWYSPIVSRMKLTPNDLIIWKEDNGNILGLYIRCILQRLIRTNSNS